MVHGMLLEIGKSLTRVLGKVFFYAQPWSAWEEIAVTFFYKDPLFVKFQGLNLVKN